MSLSKLPLPSFSLVLTCSSTEGAGPPVEVLVMKDWKQATRREVHLNLQPRDDDPLMKTVDTRFAGSMAYEVVYANASASSSSSSSACASSTSTHDVDLDTIFEADTDYEDAESEFDVGELGAECPPLHVQPSSLAQSPQHPPPRYESEAIPMRVLGSHSNAARRASDSLSSSRRRPLPRPASQFASVKFLLSILKLFRSLWRKLKKAGGVFKRVSTRGLDL